MTKQTLSDGETNATAEPAKLHGQENGENAVSEEVTDVAVVEAAAFDMAKTNPQANFAHAQQIVEFMAQKCTGPQYIATIQGKRFPKVEWWVTVGNGLNLFPREISSTRFDTADGYGYEAVVEVWNTVTDRMVTRASAICTTAEKAWGNRDEYAVRSMATTRATGKAYRIGLSALAVMAGLEPTPADEVPPQGFQDSNEHGICPDHGVPYFQSPKMRSPAHKIDGGGWCNKREVADEPEPPPKREVSTANAEALEALEDLIGIGTAFQAARVQYIKDILAREINHPDEITDDEWVRIKESAVADLAEQGDTEELDF